MSKKQRLRQAVQIPVPNNQGVTPLLILHRAQLAPKEKMLPTKDTPPTKEALPLKASLQVEGAEYRLKLNACRKKFMD